MSVLAAMTLVPLVGLAMATQGGEVAGPLWVAVLLHPWLRGLLVLKRVAVPSLVATLLVVAAAGVWPVTDVSREPMALPFYVGLVFVALSVIELYAVDRPARFSSALLWSTLALGCLAPMLRRYIGLTAAWRALPWGEWITPHQLFIGLISVQAGLACWHLAGRPRGPKRALRRALIGGVIGVSLALAAGGSALLQAHHVAINQWLADLGGGIAPPAAAGFSDQAELGSVSSKRRPAVESQIALRAFAASAPGYLRGKVYTDYELGHWQLRRPATLRRTPQRGRLTFTGGASGAGVDYMVHPAPVNGAHFFLPLNVAAVDTPCDAVEVLPGRILRSLAQPTSRGYGVVLDAEPLHDEGELQRYRVLPEDLALRAGLDRAITRFGLAGGSLEQVVERLMEQFAARYRYQIGIALDAGRDPVVQFLEEKDHGHCELFATAGTLLLRRLGHPARYVTGFLCLERNPYRKDMFVARNRHAHAWVEVYDARRGWRRVELTPPSGHPDVLEMGGWEGVAEWSRGLVQQLADLLRDGPSGLPRRFISLIADVAWWFVETPVALVALAAALVLGLVRPWRWRRAPPVAPRSWPEPLRSLRERYLAALRPFERAGLGRAEAETLAEYARRLTALERLPPGLDRTALLAALEDYQAQRYAPLPGS